METKPRRFFPPGDMSCFFLNSVRFYKAILFFSRGFHMMYIDIILDVCSISEK